jgi:hypothetical protein
VPQALRNLAVHELADGAREMSDEGWTSALVIDDRDLVALLGEAQHRAEEVVTGRAEEP